MSAHPLRGLAEALYAIGLKLLSMDRRERDFWTLRAHRATDRATRRHQASYGRRRGANGHCAWKLDHVEQLSPDDRLKTLARRLALTGVAPFEGLPEMTNG